MVNTTKRVLKCGVQVVTYSYSANRFIPHPYSERYYFYQGKELAHLSRDGVLYLNSRYLKDEGLRKILSTIKRRSKATHYGQYMKA